MTRHNQKNTPYHSFGNRQIISSPSTALLLSVSPKSPETTQPSIASTHQEICRGDRRPIASLEAEPMDAETFQQYHRDLLEEMKPALASDGTKLFRNS